MKPLNLSRVLDIPALPSYLERIEKQLKSALATDNPYIQEPIDRLLKARGKRLRPSFVIATAASQDKPIDHKVITGCVAVELIHIASLVHDDVIDNADSRWNLPTINSQEGVNRAIIIGDYLLARALEQAASVSQAVAQTIAAAFASMCDGQARELADAGNLNRTQASYLQAISGKSAALFGAACEVGARCTNLTDKQVQAFTRFGHYFGMAFQLIDDVLDFTSTPELAGKPTANDIREGVYTLPLLFGLKGPNGKKVETLLRNPDAPATLTNMLVEGGDIEKTILEAQKYNQSAAKALQGFAKATGGLAEFPGTYLDWALTNLAAAGYRNRIRKILA